MDRRLKLAGIGAGALAVVFGGSWAGWTYWSRHQPGYALAETVKAVEQHDVGAFQRYVDLDGVCHLAASEFLSRARATAEAVAPRIVDECRGRVKFAIETGMPSRERLEAAKRMKVTRVDRYGKSATVYVSVTPSGRAPSMMRLRMRDLGEYWQVAEILDIQELAEQGANR